MRDAAQLDREDDLSAFRRRFVIDDESLVYMDGNSLGRLLHATIERGAHVTSQEWGTRLIRCWNESWIDLPVRIGRKIARIVGAQAHEVILSDATSINLFKLAVAALSTRPEHRTVVTDELNFPSDIYILQSAIKFLGGGRRLVVARSPDGIAMPTDAIMKHVDHDTALVVLSHVSFKSGFLYPMNDVTARVHEAGAWMLWDLSHSVGVVPMSLAACSAEMAVGCTYKYLNGGPGAPAFLFVREDLQDKLESPIAGWFGQKDPFAFGLQYAPAEGIRRFLTGTPPILSLAAIEPGVDTVLEAGVEKIRAKSVAQTEYLIEGWKEHLQPLGFALHSPQAPALRGSHVSLGHAEAWRINRALIEKMHVIPDFRRPNNLRLGVSPLYTTYDEVARAVEAMRKVMIDRLYEEYPSEITGVT